MTVQNSTLSGNSARDGGGINSINLTLQNSTLVGNSASGSGGGICCHSSHDAATQPDQRQLGPYRQ